MTKEWWSIPWVAWPAGWLIGVLSGIAGNWAWDRLRRWRQGKQPYARVSTSGGIMRFEGQCPAIISEQELLAQILLAQGPEDEEDWDDERPDLPRWVFEPGGGDDS